MSRLLLIALLACITGPAAAETLRFESGSARVQLVELYTSEGCNSCPPADRWLTKLKDDPGLWQDFVPIAFHVDYWDYIGWEDRFAKPEFGDRQRVYAREGGSRFVYTPGLFRNGSDWHGWRRGSLEPGEATDVGVLAVEFDGDVARVEFDATRKGSADLLAHVAVLGMNRSSNVRAGENEGKKLEHVFVALDMRIATLEKEGATYVAEFELEGHTDDTALVAWVSSSEAQAPLQATGGYLPPAD